MCCANVSIAEGREREREGDKQLIMLLGSLLGEFCGSNHTQVFVCVFIRMYIVREVMRN